MNKVLVTGGCGFLGSHVCEYYINKGWEVVSYDNMTEYELGRTGYNARKARLHNFHFLQSIGVELLYGEVEDYTNLREVVNKSLCDFIIHCAAQPAMTLSIGDPMRDFRTNVVGTVNVLDIATHFNIPIVNCSTIHVYGNGINDQLAEGESMFVRKTPTISETDPILQGFVTPLHASKRAGEIYTQAYIDTYNLKAASFRLTGMYGTRQFGGQDHGWVANFAIKTAMKQSITVYGSDKQVRDILYVTDAVKAFDAFYNNPVPGIYNIGGGMKNIISIRETLVKLAEIMGIKQDITITDEKRKGDLYYFASDIRKAKKFLHWKPEVDNDDGLERLADWVKENMEVFKA